MKSIKHFSMFLFAGILSLTMFSCISDDDKNQEITRAHYSQLSGSYSGPLSISRLLTMPRK